MTSEGGATMWSQLTRMPLAQLATTEQFAYVAKVLELVAHWRVAHDDDDDAHWSSPHYTRPLAELLVVVARQCRRQLAQQQQRIDALEQGVAAAHAAREAAVAACAQRERDTLADMRELRALTQRSLDEAKARADALQREVDAQRQREADEHGGGEEVELLLAEVAWLEGERQHWLRKVRVQPLIDAKVARELQLSATQQQRLAVLTRDATMALSSSHDSDGYERAYRRAVRQRVLQARRLGDDVTRRLIDAVRCTLRGDATRDDALVQRMHEAVRTQVDRLLTTRRDDDDDDDKDVGEELRRLRDQVATLRREREAAPTAHDAAASPPAVACRDDDNATLRVLTEHADALRAELRARDAAADELRDALRRSEEAQAALQDKLTALTTMHDEACEQLATSRRTCEDMHAALRGGNDDDDGGGVVDATATRRVQVLAQRVVSLRRREGQLRQRLRSALVALDEATASERATRASMASTFAALRDALDGRNGDGDGHVLPPSMATRAPLDVLLRDMGDALTRALHGGRLQRDDRRFALQMLAAYDGMQAPQRDTTAATPAATAAGVTTTLVTRDDDDDDAIVVSRDGDDAVTASVWRQRCELCARRLDDKTRECAALEQALRATQDELLHTKSLVQCALADNDEPGKETHDKDDGVCDTHATARLLRRWGDEVARLKTINLALVQHSLDMQGNVKSLEIELDCRAQELALARRNDDAEDDADAFAAAAVREHAALRKRAARATLRARRLAVQLAASEANYHVVCNEATLYKQHAYKLYRHYVAQMADAVDFVRHVQRERAGALSPHRVALLQHRLERAEHDVATLAARNTALSGEQRDCATRASLLEQQLALVQQRDRVALAATQQHRRDDDGGDSNARDELTRVLDTTLARQRAAMTSLRESARQAAEGEAERQHLVCKLQRCEAHVRELEDEVARLQLTCTDDTLVQQLHALKDEVLAHAIQPPVAIVSATKRATRLRRRRRRDADDDKQQKSSAQVQSGDNDDDDDDDDDEDMYAVTHAHATARRAQAQLQQRCGALQEALIKAQSDAAAAAATASALRDDVAQLQAQVHEAHAQLAAERRDAQAREERVAHAHALQLDVRQRAAEHGRSCLQALLQKRDEAMAQLQAQLQAERSRATAQHAVEAARMEQLHEQLHRDHATVVERYRVAIHDGAYNNDNSGVVMQQDAQRLPQLADGEAVVHASNEAAAAATAATATTTASDGNDKGGSGTAAAALTAQLRTLTSEVLRLQGEVRRARTTNVALDGELQRLVAVVCERAGVAAAAARAQTADEDGGERDGNNNNNNSSEGGGNVKNGGGEAATGACGVDALASVLHSQNALLDSLRQREQAMADELQRERQQRVLLEQQLVEALHQHMEQRSALLQAEQLTRAAASATAAGRSEGNDVAATPTMATTTTTAAAVHELRLHVTQLQQQLQETRLQLLQARDAAAQLSRADAQQQQQQRVVYTVQHMTQLHMCSQQLRNTVDALKVQLGQLVAATTLLRQRLLDTTAATGSDTAAAAAATAAMSTSHAHDTALVQRMSALQHEAALSMQTLEQCTQTLQDQVTAASREHAALSPTPHTNDDTDAQRQAQPPPSTVIATTDNNDDDVHEPVQQQQTQTRTRHAATATRRTRAAAVPLSDEEVLQQAHVAAIVQRAVAKQREADTQELTTLRATVQTLRDALTHAQTQLRAERANVRALRTSLRDANAAAVRATAAHERDVAAWQRRLGELAAATAATTTTTAAATTTTRASTHDAHAHTPRVDVAVTAAATQTDVAVGHDNDDAAVVAVTTPPLPPPSLAAANASDVSPLSPPPPPVVVAAASATTTAAAAEVAEAAVTTARVDASDVSPAVAAAASPHATTTAPAGADGVPMSMSHAPAHEQQQQQHDGATQRARARAHENELELLQATMHNAQLIIAALTRENATLRARATTQQQRGDDSSRAAQLRDREQAVRAREQHLLHSLHYSRADARTHGCATAATSRASSSLSLSQQQQHVAVAELQRELAAARATARQYMLELHELRHAARDEAQRARNSSNDGDGDVAATTSRALHDRRAVRPLSGDAATSPRQGTTAAAADATTVQHLHAADGYAHAATSAAATATSTMATTLSVPPPLPRAPYARLTRHTAAPQTAHYADYHADMHHHHVRE